METMRGYLLVALGSVILGTISIFGKLAMEYAISPETLTALRFFLSFLLLFACACAFKRDYLRIDRRDLPLFLVFGIFGTAAERIAYFYTLDLTTPTMAIILFFTYPVFVSIYASVVHRERIAPATILAIALCLSGVALVVKVYERSSLLINLPGILFGLATALLFALYFFLTKRLRISYTNWTLILYGDGIGALALCSYAVSNRSEIVRYPPELWFFIVAIASASLLGYLIYTYALKFVESSKGSTLSVAEPLSIIFMSALFLGERIEPLQWMGVALTMIGILLLFSRFRE